MLNSGAAGVSLRVRFTIERAIYGDFKCYFFVSECLCLWSSCTTSLATMPHAAAMGRWHAWNRMHLTTTGLRHAARALILYDMRYT